MAAIPLVRHVFDPSYRQRLNEIAVYQVYHRYADLGKFKNVSTKVGTQSSEENISLKIVPGLIGLASG